MFLFPPSKKAKLIGNFCVNRKKRQQGPCYFYSLVSTFPSGTPNRVALVRVAWRTEKIIVDELAEWLDRLAASAKVATVLGLIPASSDTVESEGRHMRSSRVVRASVCQCQTRNSPGFDPSIHRHSRI